MTHVLAATCSPGLAVVEIGVVNAQTPGIDLFQARTMQCAQTAGAPDGRVTHKSLIQPANDVLLGLLEVSIWHFFMLSCMSICWAISICRHSWLENTSPAG